VIKIIKGIALIALLAGGSAVSSADARFDVSSLEARKKFREDPDKYWKLEELSEEPDFRAALYPASHFDGNAVIEDFMNRYYGKAGPILLEMRRGLDRLRRDRQAFLNCLPHA